MESLDVIIFFSWLIPTLVLFLEAALIIGLGAALANFLLGTSFLKDFYNENRERVIWFGFSVALISMLGSLFYSEILKFDPCRLCWYQRIFMYPLVVILGVAAARKDRKIGFYAIPLAVIGGMVALYHYAQQVLFHLGIIKTVINCGLQDFSCSYVYKIWYGHITIPMMALTGFVAITVLLVIALKSEKKKYRVLNRILKFFRKF